ncbi:copper amine oxidase [Effusibacillus lacus]|uniref:Copper amine oxidase n=1 Tax=Effusibacillus lacus TaxID=1348429 RepID=A0A292YM57_9BACL|nr:copper amine oxidase [Effusibacillus lacus]
MQLDGQPITFDAAPYIKNDRTLVPMRTIFEKLGATVEWDNATQTVTGKKGDTVIKLTIGSNTALVNNEPVELDVAAELHKDTGNRTMVPLRFVAESLDTEVNWDDATQTVEIRSFAYKETLTYWNDEFGNVIQKKEDAERPEEVLFQKYRYTGENVNRFRAIHYTRRYLQSIQTQVTVELKTEGVYENGKVTGKYFIRMIDTSNQVSFAETDGTYEKTVEAKTFEELKIDPAVIQEVMKYEGSR